MIGVPLATSPDTSSGSTGPVANELVTRTGVMSE